MFSMDYFVEDSLKLQDMIDNDIRSGEYYFNEFGEDLHCSQGLSIDGFDSTLDSEMSADGRSGWMSTHLLNSSADLDCLNGILVNPRTGLPNSISDAPDSPISMSPSSTDEDVAISVTSDDKMSIEGMKVSLPMQVVTSNLVNSSEAADINAISVPTPSPSPSSQSQIYLPSEGEADTADSPKPKSKSKNSKSLNSGGENTYPKPAYSYSCLIAMALKNSKMGSLPVNEIYDFMTENFPYFKTAPNGWKNSVRHNLSLNKCFEKIEKPAGNNSQRKGYLWAMNPAKIEKMEEELHKWGSKDPAAIRKSMANPERLELIEKGELRNTDSESEIENMNVSQTEDEEEYVKDEKENEVKVQVTNLGNDLLPGEFVALSDSVNIEACLPELDMQKGLWDNMYEDRMQHSFLSDSPIRPLSPKNSETMEEESETCPSAQRSYVHASYVYKVASRISLQGQSNGPVSASKGRTCNV